MASTTRGPSGCAGRCSRAGPSRHGIRFPLRLNSAMLRRGARCSQPCWQRPGDRPVRCRDAPLLEGQMRSASRLDEIGEQDGWRCWLCDEPVDPEMSVNDARGPSIHLRTTKSKAKAKAKSRGGYDCQERLAHPAFHHGKGAVAPVVPWAEPLFVVDPSPHLAARAALPRNE